MANLTYCLIAAVFALLGLYVYVTAGHGFY